MEAALPRDTTRGGWHDEDYLLNSFLSPSDVVLTDSSDHTVVNYGEFKASGQKLRADVPGVVKSILRFDTPLDPGSKQNPALIETDLGKFLVLNYKKSLRTV